MSEANVYLLFALVSMICGIVRLTTGSANAESAIAIGLLWLVLSRQTAIDRQEKRNRP